MFAGARNPDDAKDLQKLAAERPGKLYIVKLVSSDLKGNEEAISFVKEKAGRLDVVIANAGTGHPHLLTRASDPNNGVFRG